VFTEEREIFCKAMENSEQFTKEKCENIDFGEYSALTKCYASLAVEYGKLLKQLCNTTDMAEKAITELLENSIDWKDRIHFDELTGVYNRRYLEETLAHSVKTMSRFNGLLSIIMLDIDFFKKYNDTYGHSEGDTCLRSVAQSLAESITREADFVARYGGEEFVVVLPYVDENGAKVVAKRLLERIRSRNIPHRQSEVADYVTLSMGITTVTVKHSHDPKDYIKCADEGLYTSKHNGRNQYTFVPFSENSWSKPDLETVT
jgi:diguanylate cyclase (GGDEF)-like protein